MTTITHTIYRDGEEIEIEVTESGQHFEIVPRVELTNDEIIRIDEKLQDARNEEWDETSWKARREA